MQPEIRGAFGDVREPAQDVMIVLDVTEDAVTMADDRQRQVQAAMDFLGRLRSTDRAGVIVMSDREEGRVLRPSSALYGPEERNDLITELRSFLGGTPRPDSHSGVLDGVRLAADELRKAGTRNGKVVVLAGTPPNPEFEEAGSEQERDEALFNRFERALEALLGRAEQAEPSYEAHVVGLNMETNNPTVGDFSFVEDLVRFSEGRYWASTREDVAQSLTDVQQQLSGSFVLLYDVSVPCGTGKSMTLDLELELTLDENQRATAEYLGPIRVARPQACSR